MSFNSNTTTYKSTHKQLQSVKVKDITTCMQEILNFSRQQLKKSRESMKAQVDKHQKNVNVGDIVWLSGQNIKITQSSCNIKDRQLEPFCVSQHVRMSYHLRLHVIMRTHNQTPPPAPIVTNNKGH